MQFMQEEFQPQSSLYYKIAYFFISHQILIKRLLFFLLIFVNVIIWSFVIVKSVNYLTSIKSHNYMISLIVGDGIDFANYKATHAPKNINIINNYFISRADGKYDFLAKIKNPNANWAANILKYRFTYAGGQTKTKESFIMPGKEKYLFAFGQELKFPISDIKLVVEEVGWYRVKNNENLAILNDLSASQEKFIRFDKSSAVSFLANNKSPYNFWSIGWQIILYRGSDPIAVNYITTNQFLALSNQETQATWFENLPTPTKIDIISDINILSEEIFMKVNYDPGRALEIDN